MAMIPDSFLNAVVAVGIRDKNDANKRLWIGTGFLVGRKETDENFTVYLVTNRHVISNQEELLIKFNEKGANATKDYFFYLYDHNGTQNFSAHHNEKVDIVAIGMQAGYLDRTNAKIEYFRLDNALSLEEMKNTGVVEGSLVYALGFPMNLVGEKRKLRFAD